ncbi:MAG: PilN domain-containing protein [Minisyncoccales bacterium]
MINLLPPEYKKELSKEEQYKIVLTLGIFVLLFLICFSLILLSIEIYVSGQLEIKKEFIKQSQKEMNFSEIEGLEQKIKSVNENISALVIFYGNQTSIIKISEEISNLIPSGIYLNNISINSSKEKDYRFLVSLSGFSPSRELLLELESNIKKKEEFFKASSFPQSTWTKPVEIDFSLNLKI